MRSWKQTVDIIQKSHNPATRTSKFDKASEIYSVNPPGQIQRKEKTYINNSHSQNSKQIIPRYHNTRLTHFRGGGLQSIPSGNGEVPSCLCLGGLRFSIILQNSPKITTNRRQSSGSETRIRLDRLPYPLSNPIHPINHWMNDLTLEFHSNQRRIFFHRIESEIAKREMENLNLDRWE